MPAFQLGTDCPLSKKLIDAGLLSPEQGMLWRIKTREATKEGELMQTGDYIKLDSIGMPYPVKRDWFEAHHTPVAPGLYLQNLEPKHAWCQDEPMCDEIQFLLRKGLLQWDAATGFGAELWDTWQTADSDAIIIFDQVQTDSTGKILQVDFHFVAADEFSVTYDIL